MRLFIYAVAKDAHTVARPDAPPNPPHPPHPPASCLHNFLLQIILLGQLLHPLLKAGSWKFWNPEGLEWRGRM